MAATYYVRAVPGVNEDLVVRVSLPLHLLRAVGSGRLGFAAGGNFISITSQTKLLNFKSKSEMRGYLSDTGGVMSRS